MKQRCVYTITRLYFLCDAGNHKAYVWERTSRGKDRAVIYKIKDLQLSTLRKAIFTGIVLFDSHKTPGRYETSGSRFLLSEIEI